MKKRRFVLVLFVLISCTPALAQSTAPVHEIMIDQIKKTVVFLQTNWKEPSTQNIPGTKEQLLTKSEVGTGFVIFVPIPELGKNASGHERGCLFLVTAKHMIRQVTPDHKPGPYAKNLTVMFNNIAPHGPSGQLRDQADVDIIDSRGDLRWFVDGSDPIADVALQGASIDPNIVEFKSIQQDWFATKSVIEEEHVNENDEVLFAGLFTGFISSHKNYPVVRRGHLALWPGEDIPLDSDRPNYKTQIYMAEVTSFGGNSGSPVFLRLGGVRESVDVKLEAYSYRLLGVMSGFFRDPEMNQNSGIAVIVPADKINNILASDRMKAEFARVIASDKTTNGDLSAAEAKFKEAIGILERQAPESSQLVETLEDYANMLQIAKRTNDSNIVRTKAQKIKSQPVSKAPMP